MVKTVLLYRFTYCLAVLSLLPVASLHANLQAVKQKLVGKWTAVSGELKMEGSSSAPTINTYQAGDCTLEYLEDGTYVVRNTHSAQSTVAVRKPLDPPVVLRGKYKVVGKHKMKKTLLEMTPPSSAGQLAGVTTTSEFTVDEHTITTSGPMFGPNGSKKIGVVKMVFARVPR